MKELAQRLAKLNQMINAEFPVFANNPEIGVGLGMTALAAINRRIVQTGQTADGGSFKPYSSKPALVGAKSFRTQAAAQSVFGSKDKRKALQWRTIDRGGAMYRLAILPGGYKQIRTIEGSQVAHKSFLRGGEMWKSIHVQGTTGSNGKFITTVGTENELSNKKLEGNVKREGKEILQTSPKEDQMLTNLLDKFITKLVQRALNG
jgi:hypothetical protein